MVFCSFKLWSFGFGPKLVEKGKFFRLFSLFSAFSICTESTFKVQIAERKKIVHQVYDPPFNFLEILLFNFIRLVEIKNIRS